MPVLPMHRRIKKLLDDLCLFDSPCHHLLKQYDLLMNMAYTYTRAFVISNYRNMEGVEDLHAMPR